MQVVVWSHCYKGDICWNDSGLNDQNSFHSTIELIGCPCCHGCQKSGRINWSPLWGRSDSSKIEETVKNRQNKTVFCRFFEFYLICIGLNLSTLKWSSVWSPFVTPLAPLWTCQYWIYHYFKIQAVSVLESELNGSMWKCDSMNIWDLMGSFA